MVAANHCWWFSSRSLGTTEWQSLAKDNDSMFNWKIQNQKLSTFWSTGWFSWHPWRVNMLKEFKTIRNSEHMGSDSSHRYLYLFKTHLQFASQFVGLRTYLLVEKYLQYTLVTHWLRENWDWPLSGHTVPILLPHSITYLPNGILRWYTFTYIHIYIYTHRIHVWYIC